MDRSQDRGDGFAATRHSAEPEPQERLGRAGECQAQDEFCAQFKARMLGRSGPTFGDGTSVADYADEAASAYWETDWQRALGPEECADADISYWGEE